MHIRNLFSKRQKALRGELPDVYRYDTLPQHLKVQITHIVNDALGFIGDDRRGGRGQIFGSVRDILCREYGLLSLLEDEEYHTLANVVLNFFLHEGDVERCMDIVELLFQKIDTFVRAQPYYFTGRTLYPDEAIEVLNARFKENGIGFEYAAGQIIRIDSQMIHQEVVKPVLQLLENSKFKGANEEFLSAHAHYREGKYKECLNDGLKAFESTLKVICHKRGWAFKATDTAKNLIDLVLEKELIPPFLQSHFTGIRSTLEGGVPTVRNKLGDHGQGTQAIEVPSYIAAYALHLTATSILLLFQADAAFGK